MACGIMFTIYVLPEITGIGFMTKPWELCGVGVAKSCVFGVDLLLRRPIYIHYDGSFSIFPGFEFQTKCAAG